MMRRTMIALVLAGALGLAGCATMPAKAPTEASRAGTVFRDCALCPAMVVVPPGRFLMGVDGGEKDRYEGPVREVRIGRPFAAGRYEVTQGEYAAFVNATGHVGGQGCNVWRSATRTLERDATLDWRNPGYGRPPRDDEPVACISWNDAQAYVAWLRATSGEPYRLLTEAEWEYVARAGSQTRFPWGEDPELACRYANVYDASAADPGIPWSATRCADGYPTIAPVGRFASNAFGLYDTIGNVWEWVEDCYAMPYPAQPVDGSAQSTVGCDRRGSRGGAWRTEVVRQRAAFRGRDPATLLSGIFGMRVARDLPQRR